MQGGPLPSFDVSARPAMVAAAAAWLVETPFAERPGPVVDHLKQRFGLSAAECCQAAKTAGELRRERPPA